MKKIWHYVITFGVTSIITFLILLHLEIFSTVSKIQVFHKLTDAFFASGTFVLCFGLLLFVSNEGGFNIFSYGIRKFFDLFRKKENQVMKESYYDYTVRRGSNKFGFTHLIVIGTFFILLSLLFLYIYTNL